MGCVLHICNVRVMDGVAGLVNISRSWGVCFTYAAWFALEAFACMGHTFDNL